MAPSLTQEQLAAAWHDGGHAIVSAVPGSGKTECLLARVRYLLNTVPAKQIGIFMFNKDAAASFRTRYAKLAGGSAAPEIRTFNSVGNSIHKLFQKHGLLPRSQLSVSESARRAMVRSAAARAVREVDGSDAKPTDTQIDGFLTFLAHVKTDVRSPEEMFDEGNYSPWSRFYPKAYRYFEADRIQQGRYFYEDQVRDPVLVMLKDRRGVELVENYFEHILCDECQDMNPAQIELVKFIAGDRAKVMIVGDEDQSIYEWRGATPSFMLKGFEQHFGKARHYQLPHTFRFGHQLALAANHLIVKNTQRTDKFCLSHASTPDTQVHTHVHDIGRKLGQVLVEQAMQNPGHTYSDIAILVRYYAHVVALELDLLDAGIPYHVYGREPLIRVPEVSAMLGLLQLCAGAWNVRLSPDDRAAAIRSILNVPTIYLDGQSLQRIVHECEASPELLTPMLRGLIQPDWKDYKVQTIRDRADLLEIVQGLDPQTTTAKDVFDLYLQGTNYKDALLRQHDTRERAQEVIRTIESIVAMAAEHGGNVTAFLEHVAPIFEGQTEEPPRQPHVWISSIHRSKGLGWKHVILPGWGAGIVPPDGATSAEEERRLAYVALTRAIESVHVLHPPDAGWEEAKSKPDFGVDLQCKDGTASPYLWDLNLPVVRHCTRQLNGEDTLDTDLDVFNPDVVNRYLTLLDRAELARYRPAKVKFDRNASKALSVRGIPTPSSLPVGTQVRVDSFGRGTVVGWLQHRAVKIQFLNGDTKIADVSKLKIEVV